MPGTTHARAAQTVTLGHHLLAHAWALLRDLERVDRWAARTSVSPLGAGAMATSTLGLDPAAAAARLGIRSERSTTRSTRSRDRDFVQEFLADASIFATHSRAWPPIWRGGPTPRSGWAELDEAYSTGSSMMPQKRNPDTAELARAKAARIAGGFVSADSGAARAAARLPPRPPGGQGAGVRCRRHARAGAAGAGRGRRDRAVRRGAMRAAASDEGLYATDLAEALVRHGVPFREAHRRTGELLKQLATESRSMRDLTAEEWSSFGVPDGGGAAEPGRLRSREERRGWAVAGERHRSSGRDRGVARGALGAHDVGRIGRRQVLHARGERSR